jgi:hypothetical protein
MNTTDDQLLEMIAACMRTQSGRPVRPVRLSSGRVALHAGPAREPFAVFRSPQTTSAWLEAQRAAAYGRTGGFWRVP